MYRRKTIYCWAHVTMLKWRGDSGDDVLPSIVMNDAIDDIGDMTARREMMAASKDDAISRLTPRRASRIQLGLALRWRLMKAGIGGSTRIGYFNK